MINQKSHSHLIFCVKNLFISFLCISINLLVVKTQNAEALFMPTLSASVGQANLQVNGNQVINSVNSSTEIPLDLTINTNNKTGYTVSISSVSNNTALTNPSSTSGLEGINSITSNLSINDFPANTWGYKLSTNLLFNPIPALGNPDNIIQTQDKTNGDEKHILNLGLKLNPNLESGLYGNSLIFSIVTNPYNPTAIMSNGVRFGNLVDTLETYSMTTYGQKQKKTKIEHIKHSRTLPINSMTVINVEDETSEAEIKVWFDENEKTLYYYSVPEKIYLNSDSSGLFSKYQNLQDIDLSSFDTSLVINMDDMFAGSHIKVLDVSNFNTKNVTNMDHMFSQIAVTHLNLSNFDTSNVTNMNGMFSSCINLTTLDLSSFNTEKVTNMGWMFYNMSGLKSINLTSFNTEKVTDMNNMFREVKKIEYLDLSSFKTPQLENISGMFSQTHALKTLDLSNFITSKVWNMSQLFDVQDYQSSTEWNQVCNESNDNLTTIYSSHDFQFGYIPYESYKKQIFNCRTKLRGGNGSLINPGYDGYYSLKIDRPGSRGLLTLKQ